ncbi:hypothetical protein E1B28_010025 [Marasmius oreades]|uniref:G-alpha-domain-containing protein n=1 Tax=Marasmius oreades TaxID=181124 RepID=A0A9P7RWE9_9AGAR|nr:uncharacterized protein E1B28_010025 [Marasmius oreades]KAG7090957.1 hypothetical protein E1B28_010025 [Marasmius oreades]
MVASRTKRNTVDDDPLTRAIAPPPNETEAEREARLAAEQLAKKRSDQIDEEINQQRLVEKREQASVKVLLLGQSESGKTTTIKNFQLISQPKAFRSELPLWRAIIQLNVTRSIRIILDAMSTAQTANLNLTSTSTTTPLPPPNSDYSPISRPSSSYSPRQALPQVPLLTPEQLKLKMRLSPLTQVEEALMRRLSPSSPAGSLALLSTTTSFPFPSNRSKEITVYSASGWKGAFAKFVAGMTRSSMDSQDINFDDPEDPGVILHNCSEDMVKLWNDEGIRRLLESQNLRLEDMSGFFLDSLERITALKYIPTTEDILRARLKTIGVTEHRFVLKAGNMLSRDWRVFDVGGARNLVPAWAPYFDDMNAIIFLAPLSCFDQSLAEDYGVNRLEDSILLWRSIVKHPLLQKTELILFLNKCDLLKAKLDSGTQFSHWVVSYGDRPNTFESVSGYMKKKFGTIHKQHSDKPRTFYCHFTSVTNAQTTFHILENVRDLIIRQSLTTSHLV